MWFNVSGYGSVGCAGLAMEQPLQYHHWPKAEHYPEHYGLPMPALEAVHTSHFPARSDLLLFLLLILFLLLLLLNLLFLLLLLLHHLLLLHLHLHLLLQGPDGRDQRLP
jgi:hypothetical protein